MTREWKRETRLCRSDTGPKAQTNIITYSKMVIKRLIFKPEKRSLGQSAVVTPGLKSQLIFKIVSEIWAVSTVHVVCRNFIANVTAQDSWNWQSWVNGFILVFIYNSSKSDLMVQDVKWLKSHCDQELTEAGVKGVFTLYTKKNTLHKI